MGIRDKYENGVFSWVDLITTEQDGAKEFYSTLFNWDFEDLPVDNQFTYSMAFKNGRKVAAIFLLSEEKRTQNIPPHWQSYINVKGLEEIVGKWQKHGGVVLSPPCEVMEAGRMAVVKDPTDSSLCLWQAKDHIGAEVVNEINTFCWSELQTRNRTQAIEFYQAIFDWNIIIEEQPPYYGMSQVKGNYNCGFFDLSQANLPSDIPNHWAVYFNVENLDASLELINRNGGKSLTPKMKTDVGFLATISDPQGAVLTLIELENPDD